MRKDGRRQARGPGVALLRPLVMLALGVLAGIAMWRVLEFEPGDGFEPAERLSHQDRHALERMLERRVPAR